MEHRLHRLVHQLVHQLLHQLLHQMVHVSLDKSIDSKLTIKINITIHDVRTPDTYFSVTICKVEISIPCIKTSSVVMFISL